MLIFKTKECAAPTSRSGIDEVAFTVEGEHLFVKGLKPHHADKLTLIGTIRLAQP